MGQRVGAYWSRLKISYNCCWVGVATRLDEVGLSARQIADHLGHAAPSMTQDVYMGRRVASSDAAKVLDR